MSDTPKTDTNCGWPVGHHGRIESSDLKLSPDGPFVHSSVARELERENAALRADKERLEWIETNARLTRKVGYLRWSFEGPECGTVRGSIDIARGKEAQP